MDLHRCWRDCPMPCPLPARLSAVPSMPPLCQLTSTCPWAICSTIRGFCPRSWQA
jgi:hypothetical protein